MLYDSVLLLGTMDTKLLGFEGFFFFVQREIDSCEGYSGRRERLFVELSFLEFGWLFERRREGQENAA